MTGITDPGAADRFSPTTNDSGIRVEDGESAEALVLPLALARAG
jgi:hypothetical protein